MAGTKKSKPAKKGLFERLQDLGTSTIKKTNEKYGGGARKRALDAAIEGTSQKRKKPSPQEKKTPKRNASGWRNY